MKLGSIIESYKALRVEGIRIVPVYVPEDEETQMPVLLGLAPLGEEAVNHPEQVDGRAIIASADYGETWTWTPFGVEWAKKQS